MQKTTSKPTDDSRKTRTPGYASFCIKGFNALPHIRCDGDTVHSLGVLGSPDKNVLFGFGLDLCIAIEADIVAVERVHRKMGFQANQV